MFIRRSTHNTIVQELVGGRIALKDQLREQKKLADQWRAEAELLRLTPEIKADTEGAFKRGHAHAIRQIKAWLFTSITQLENSGDSAETQEKSQ